MSVGSVYVTSIWYSPKQRGFFNGYILPNVVKLYLLASDNRTYAVINLTL